jgi:hypothetical protein
MTPRTPRNYVFEGLEILEPELRVVLAPILDRHYRGRIPEEFYDNSVTRVQLTAMLKFLIAIQKPKKRAFRNRNIKGYAEALLHFRNDLSHSGGELIEWAQLSLLNTHLLLDCFGRDEASARVKAMTQNMLAELNANSNGGVATKPQRPNDNSSDKVRPASVTPSPDKGISTPQPPGHAVTVREPTRPAQPTRLPTSGFSATSLTAASGKEPIFSRPGVILPLIMAVSVLIVVPVAIGIESAINSYKANHPNVGPPVSQVFEAKLPGIKLHMYVPEPFMKAIAHDQNTEDLNVRSATKAADLNIGEPLNPTTIGLFVSDIPQLNKYVVKKLRNRLGDPEFYRTFYSQGVFTEDWPNGQRDVHSMLLERGLTKQRMLTVSFSAPEIEYQRYAPIIKGCLRSVQPLDKPLDRSVFQGSGPSILDKSKVF